VLGKEVEVILVELVVADVAVSLSGEKELKEGRWKREMIRIWGKRGESRYKRGRGRRGNVQCRWPRSRRAS
jgi:hypothetical protein